MAALRMLGVLLCYNDGDILATSLAYLLEQGHQVVAWDHGSTDSTPAVLSGLKSELLEVRTVPRSVDFYDLYPMMSEHLRQNYVSNYDWVSWPDQDEFLEGPDRSRPYRQWCEEVAASPYDWVEFNNFNYWWTTDDDPGEPDAVKRVRHYALFEGCAPRIRAWRASATNTRQFNHNPPDGQRYPQLFNLRHYPMRDEAQMTRRLEVDRAGLRRGNTNFHYENMSSWRQRLVIDPSLLHVDDGDELNPALIFDWRTIYGW